MKHQAKIDRVCEQLRRAAGEGTYSGRWPTAGRAMREDEAIDGDETFPPGADEGLDLLLELLHKSRRFDFTGYKRGSLTRRIRRRMQAVGVSMPRAPGRERARPSP